MPPVEVLVRSSLTMALAPPANPDTSLVSITLELIVTAEVAVLVMYKSEVPFGAVLPPAVN